MPPNTSATGGYLVPSSTAPLQDDGLADALQEMVVGITGLDPTLVRPRWQAVPPKQPEATVNWAAVGETRIDNDTYAAILHDPAGEGSDTLYRSQVLEVVASFYGPNRYGYATLFADGLLIPQNNEAIQRNGLFLMDPGSVVLGTSELVNMNWIPKADVRVTFSRQIARTYPILNVLEAEGTIHSERASQQFDTEN